MKNAMQLSIHLQYNSQIQSQIEFVIVSRLDQGGAEVGGLRLFNTRQGTAIEGLFDLF